MGQKKSKYALNVWRMCSPDILLMNPISLPVFGTLETWLFVALVSVLSLRSNQVNQL